MPSRAKNVGVAVLVLALAGLLFVFPFGLGALLDHGRKSDWSWWYYFLALPVIGAAGILFEGIGSIIFAPFTWGGEDQPPWKRAMFRLFVFLAICVGLVFALSPWWLAKLGTSNAI